MNNARQGLHTERDFGLEGGAVLAQASTAYRTLGRLNGKGDNAVLVLHGYTTGPAMLDAGSSAAEGSWSDLVGPGRAIDTERWFVVCPNMLGSCYGSTGPGSIDPGTGRRYGIDFPLITVSDIVTLQKGLLDALGVRHLAAVTGPSLGGYQALQWAASYPAMVDRVVAAVSAPYNPAGVGQSAALLDQFNQQAAWGAGHPEPGAMFDCLTQMRVTTLTRYGIDAELTPEFPEASGRAAELLRLAREWAQGFEPGSLLTLARAAESFDLREQLGAIRAPLLLVQSRSDQVFSPELTRAFAPLLSAAGIPWSYVELDSDKGHFASGADSSLWSGVLRRFMDSEPSAWASWGMAR